jgi:anti-anti-sigma regulatory factor
MIRQLNLTWNQLITVRTTPPHDRARARWVLGSVGVLVGVLVLGLLPSQGPLLRSLAATSVVWDITTGTRALLVVCVAAWIGWRGSWRPTTVIEQRQGRIVATLSAIMIFTVSGLVWLVPLVYDNLLYALGYFQIITLNLYILWLAQRGYVRAAATLTLVNLIGQVVLNMSVSTQNIVVIIFMFCLLVAGLLLRWWACLLLPVTYPLLVLSMQAGGVYFNTTHTTPAIIAETILFLGFATLLALYARSLETALQSADQRAIDLAATQQHLADRNGQLEQQTVELQTARAELQQTVAMQEQRIAEAVAALRSRSIELNTIQTPLIRVAEGVLVAPLIGAWDAERATTFLQTLLTSVEQHRAHTVVLDLTGLELRGNEVVHLLDQALRATQLLGCDSILVGVTPRTAHALVTLGLDWQRIRTALDLAAGLTLGLRRVATPIVAS